MWEKRGKGGGRYIEITAIRITNRRITRVGGVGAAAGRSAADLEPRTRAGMRSHSSRNRVCFPDVHLGAAGAVGAKAGVGAVGLRGPACAVGLAGNEFQVTRALRVLNLVNYMFGDEWGSKSLPQ